MTILPTINIDFTIVRVAAIVTVFVFGYLLHELMHIIPLELAGVDYSVEFAPGDAPTWYNLTFGRAFEFETTAHPLIALMSLLAPGILTLPGWYLWAQILQADVVSLSSATFVATWIIVFLPSLADWAEAHAAFRALRSA